VPTSGSGRIDAYVGSTPATSGFPDATNTGVPSGTTLTPFSGSYFTSADNEIVDALDVSGNIVVQHANVLVKRCRAVAPNDYCLYIDTGGLNCTVQDTELDGSLTGSTGILMVNNVQALRLNIHGCENGGQVNSGGGLIKDSWIHDLSSEATGFHTDGLQFASDASALTIDHCNFEPVPSHVRDATSCINIYNEAGATQNHDITITNSRIDGRGCAVACFFPRFSGWSNIVVTNNRLRAGDTGYSDSGVNTTTWTGNVDDATGATVNAGD
jgi:hypothetical protein